MASPLRARIVVGSGKAGHVREGKIKASRMKPVPKYLVGECAPPAVWEYTHGILEEVHGSNFLKLLPETRDFSYDLYNGRFFL